VTDFRNITASVEDDWLGTGISETVTADLMGLEGIAVVPRERMYALARTLEQQSGEAAETLWLRAGRELGARCGAGPEASSGRAMPCVSPHRCSTSPPGIRRVPSRWTAGCTRSSPYRNDSCVTSRRDSAR
jgi:hypothetical protein